MKRIAWTLVSMALLVACGGGGGSGGGDWLRIDPPQLTMQVYEGDPSEFGVTATIVDSPPGGSGAIHAGLVDPDGVLRPDWRLINTNNDAQFIIYMHISESLRAGKYTGALQFRLCQDDPVICAQPVSGSPWSIRYDFTILEGDHLTPLVKLPDVGPWSTWQGGTDHRGAIPATLDVANFTRRFGHRGNVSGVAIADGLAYVTVEGTEQPSSTFTLLAIRESDGGVEWSASLGSPWSASAPAVGNGQVYVSSESFFRVFDAKTGELLTRLYTSAYANTYGAPELSGTIVYAGCGNLGGLMRVDSGTLTAAWCTPYEWLNQDVYTFAVDAGHVYGTTMSPGLEVFDAATGEHQTWIPDQLPPGVFHAHETGGLVMGDGGLAFRSYLATTNDDDWQGRLIAYDLTVPDEEWALSDHFTSAPVVANGVLYVVNGNYLEARNPTTGARTWRWTPAGGLVVPDGSITHVAVAGNIAFVSDYVNTFGVDLTTHETVWVYPGGGPLAISDNGVLYISVRTGTLAAVNLH